MNDSTILMRQVHPSFFPNNVVSSQAFLPFPKDVGKLSVYDGDQISAEKAYEHYKNVLKFESIGVWGVSCAEVEAINLSSTPDPLENFPYHALIDFNTSDSKKWRKLAKQLKRYAVERGRLYPLDT